MTMAQMRIFLKEGERIRKMDLAQGARTIRSAVWAESDDFEDGMKSLEG